MSEQTKYIEIKDMAKLFKDYVEYSETHNIIFDIYSFQELSLLFADIDIFDELIGDFNTSKIDKQLTKKNRTKICKVFNKKDTKELTSFILIMYRNSLDLIRVMAINLRYTKKVGNDFVLEEEPTQEPKGYHFFTPIIALYDLRIEINIIIKTLLENGETEKSLSNINMVFARYMFLQLRGLGI